MRRRLLRPSALLLLCSFTLVSFINASPARADEMFSFRGGLSFGERQLKQDDEFIYAFSLTGDMLWGPAHPRAFRAGPAFEGRTTRFKTIEGAYGLTILMPLPLDMTLTTNGMIGLAWRSGTAPDGWMGVGTVTLGYRSYNFHGWYGYGLNVFFSGRKQIHYDLIEYTGGIEVDMLFALVIPYLAIRNWMNKGDPHED